MNILVTGSSGYVGSAIVPTLTNSGHNVISQSRTRPNGRGISKPLRQLNAGDLDGIDVVVHLSGVAHTRNTDARSLWQANVVDTQHLGDVCAQAKTPRLLYLSSLKVLGATSPPDGFSAESPVQPPDMYAASKAAAELLLLTRAGQPQTIVLRSPVVYGPHPKANVASLLRYARLGLPIPFESRSAIRSFVSIGNLCSALEFLCHAEISENQTFSVTDGASVAVFDFYSMMHAAFGTNPRTLPRFVKLPVERSRYLESAAGPLVRSCFVGGGGLAERTAWAPRERAVDAVAKMVDSRG